MQFLLPLIYALLFIFLILKMDFFIIPSIEKNKLVGLFVIKLAAAFLVGVIYTFYYSGGDFFTYFSDSSVLINNFVSDEHDQFSVWTGSFEGNSVLYGAKMMIIINAVMQLFSVGNIYVHFVFFCFFSFIGFIALLKILTQHFPDKTNLVLLFFIPSVLFWSSAPLKESITMGAAGVLIYLCDFGLKIKYTIINLFFITLLILLLAAVKIYILLALIPAFICNYIVSRSSNKFWIPKFVLVLVPFYLIAMLLSNINPDSNILKQISDKQVKAISEAKGGVFLVNDKHFISLDYKKQASALLPQKDSTYKIKNGSSYLRWNLDNMSDTTFISNSNDSATYSILYKVVPANSIIHLKRLKPSIREYIAYSPIAFFNTLIHPTVFEIRSWLHFISALENIGICILILLSVFFFDRKVLKKKEIIFFCLTFSIIVYVIIGMTTPAIGAMVRYKTTAMLFLITACFLMIDQEKLKNSLLRKNT
jgi:hypothetical protein